jgi:Cys-tRNA(Pro)/Cys-tRNA(Cys) deacylase
LAARATPATRAARTAGIAFTLHEYDHDPSAGSYAMEAATALAVDAARVLKTIVVDRDGALTVCILGAGDQLDLRHLGKRATLAAPETAERVTGYVIGGISPFGQRRRLPTIVDESAGDHATVFVSAGRRGLEIELAPADLVRLTGAEVARLRRQ